MKYKFLILQLFFIAIVCCPYLYATSAKGVYTVTASSLNVRSGASINSNVIGTVKYGEKFQGEQANVHWVKINYHGRTAYISTKYSKLTSSSVDTQNQPQSYKKKRGGGIGLGWWLAIIFFGAPAAIGFLRGLWDILWDIIGSNGLFYIAFYVILLPFRMINWLQFFLHKPWRIIQKHSWRNDTYKEALRIINVILLAPLYVVLTPLRLINAIAFNMILRVVSEFWNYLCEVISPSSWDEGAEGIVEWVIYFPLRFLKYPVYHGILTIIECVAFTIIDTVYPALTLYHGTSAEAADTIVICPNRTREGNSANRMEGIWNVGSGNYAGDGIYFAPSLSTSRHYARHFYRPVIIICRVSLGRILPLSLAPWNVYSQAGKPNAHGVTRYGLNNAYTSIEWWRNDNRWWEYCLLDWQNKYNESWRIRPVMVLNLNSHFFKRIGGGSRHWLFDSLILNDIDRTLSEV